MENDSYSLGNCVRCKEFNCKDCENNKIEIGGLDFLKDIFNILDYCVNIREKLSTEEKNFLVQELVSLFVEYIPPKSQTQAKVSGVWFESEYDEGFNACIEELRGSLQ